MSVRDLSGVIERRLLVNYRVDPAVAAGLLPPGLRPQLVDGWAVAGICLIRMAALRPAGLQAAIGWRGEAAAHRIAVAWDARDEPRTGVFVPLRQSSSVLPVLAGGRVIPGVHHRARFDVHEDADRYRVLVTGTERIAVDVRATPGAFTSGLFPSLAAASDFFRSGSIGWSPDRRGRLEGLTLDTDRWSVRAATAESVSSSFFDRLPRGAAEYDSTLVMRDVPVTWSRTRGSDRPEPAAVPA